MERPWGPVRSSRLFQIPKRPLRFPLKGVLEGDINTGIDALYIYIDIDRYRCMAASGKLAVLLKGFRAPFKRFGVAIRQALALSLIRTIWLFLQNGVLCCECSYNKRPIFLGGISPPPMFC